MSPPFITVLSYSGGVQSTFLLERVLRGEVEKPLRFPLVEEKITKADCLAGFERWGIAPPPRSVCVACFANGLGYFRDMYRERPADWQKAVEVDNAVEQWNKRGITEQEVFVSRSLIRLRDMPAMGFGQDDPALEEQHCNSGACFI